MTTKEFLENASPVERLEWKLRHALSFLKRVSPKQHDEYVDAKLTPLQAEDLEATVAQLKRSAEIHLIACNQLRKEQHESYEELRKQNAHLRELLEEAVNKPILQGSQWCLDVRKTLAERNFGSGFVRKHSQDAIKKEET